MIPIKLTIYNFLSHDKSEIDFSKFNSALILGSYNGDFKRSNGSGKSAIFRGISWVLFEKTDHKKKDGVVKKDRKFCRVEFIFSTNNITYKITRKRDKVLSESEVFLEQFDGVDFKDISCDTNTLTNAKLEEIIGLNYEIFVNSVYFKQNDVSMFADSTPSKRKDIVKALLRIERWDEYQKRAKDKARILSARIEEKSKHSISIDGLKDSIKKCEFDINNLRSEIEEQNSKYSKIRELIQNKKSLFGSKFGNRSESLEKLRSLNKTLSLTKNKIAENKHTISENNTIIQKCQKDLLSLKGDIKVLAEKIKKGKEIDIEKLNAMLVSGRTKERVLKEQIQTLEKDLKLGPNCPVCKKSLVKKEIESITQSRKKELEEVRENYAHVKSKLQGAEEKFYALQKIAGSINKMEVDKSKLEIKLEKLSSSLSGAIKENERVEKESEYLESQNYSEQIKALQEKLNKEESQKLEEEISNGEKEATTLKNIVDKLNVEYGSLIKNKEDLEKQEKLQDELQTELDKLNSDHAIYSKLREYFGKEGIQSIIIENIIDELENYTNDILSKICNEPMTIAIKTQKQSENGSWTETFDIEVTSNGRTDEFETFSGGEQFRISLALRLALSKILSKRMGGTVKFLLLDEVSSSLDDEGMDLFVNIIKQLSNEMKVLIITHDEKLKDKFDDVIIVNKTQGGSKITHNY